MVVSLNHNTGSGIYLLKYILNHLRTISHPNLGRSRGAEVDNEWCRKQLPNLTPKLYRRGGLGWS